MIVESSLWKDEESVSQGQGQTARSRDCRVPCRCSTPSVPLISSSSSSSSSMSSSFSCECLAACHPTLTAASLSATSASESTSLFGVEPTSILPFLFLGSQRDALSSDVINVSSLFDYSYRYLRCLFAVSALTPLVGGLVQWPASFVAYERSYPTSGPVSTGMGDRLWAGIPSRYVTSQLG